jgi:hypothetical protein
MERYNLFDVFLGGNFDVFLGGKAYVFLVLFRNQGLLEVFSFFLGATSSAKENAFFEEIVTNLSPQILYILD